MSTYAEKAAAYGTPSGYPVQSGYDGSNDYYRQQTYVGQTAYPQGYTTQTYNQPQYVMPQQGIYGYHLQQDNQSASRMNSFNAVAPPPNFSRPPPGQMGKDDYQNPSLALYDTSAQSSAAYTASWVSSTSSIRPDMPEGGGTGLPQMVGDFGQWNNPDQGGDSGVTSGGSNPYGQAIEQFGKMSINEQQGYDNPPGAWGQIESHPQHNAGLNNQAQWPGLDEASERMNKDKKREEREKRQREEAPAKDLTWEERLKRAQGAKDRAENPRFERREETERGRGRGRGMFRGGPPGRGQMDESQRDSRYSNGQRRQPMQNGEMDLGGNQLRGGMRGSISGRGGAGGTYGGVGGMQQQGNVSQSLQQMSMYRGGPPPQGLMAPPPHHYLPPGSIPSMITQQQPQDQKFRNSWLDANLFGGPFPMPFPPMDYQMASMMRGRGGGRGRGGMGMGMRGRGGRYRQEERDGEEGMMENGEERFPDDLSQSSQNIDDQQAKNAQENQETQEVNVVD